MPGTEKRTAFPVPSAAAKLWMYLFWTKLRKTSFALRRGRTMGLFVATAVACALAQALIITPAVAFHCPDVDAVLFEAKAYIEEKKWGVKQASIDFKDIDPYKAIETGEVPEAASEAPKKGKKGKKVAVA